MRYLLLSVLIISLVGIFMISQSDAQEADTTPPVVNVPADIVVESPDGTAQEITFVVTATDDVGVTSGPVCQYSELNPPNTYTLDPSWFPGGQIVIERHHSDETITITCSASDAAGNTGTGTFTVNVTYTPPADTTPPIVNVPADIVVTTTNSSGADVGALPVSATDEGVKISNTDGNTLSCDRAGGNPYPVGTTTITCWATDAAGNVGTASFTITVILVAGDTTPPVVNVPADMTVTTTNSSGAEVRWGSVTASDDVKLAPGGVGCNNSRGNTLPVGTTTITCSATDTSGNEGSASFTITVILVAGDTTPPVVNVPAVNVPVVNVPADIVVDYSDVDKWTTFLKLDSLAPIPTSGQIQRTVDIFGQLDIPGRTSSPTNPLYAEIKLVFTGFTHDGKDHKKIITNEYGAFEFRTTMPVGEGYAIQAVYDGNLIHQSSKSQTEYFDVRTSSQSQLPEVTNWPAMIFWMVIIAVIVGVVVRKIKRKKKIPVTIPPPSGRRTAGTATMTKSPYSKPKPRAGKAPLLMGKIRQVKRAVGKQSPKVKKKKDVMYYLRCKQCHLEEFLENEANGQQYCTKCGWKKQ